MVKVDKIFEVVRPGGLGTLTKYLVTNSGTRDSLTFKKGYFRGLPRRYKSKFSIMLRLV